MNKPLSRRLFGKAMAALPMAAQEAAKTLALDAAAANTAGELAAAGVNVATGSMPMPYGIGYALQDPTIMALFKSGLTPDWVLDDIDRQLDERGRYLSTDVASLRSVSASSKVLINKRRQRDEFMRTLERRTLIDAARDAFWRKRHAQPQ